ncbi:MAG: hypothetical protein A2031_04030, partial [Deltaproteobacteria bacterium RBG_19FT_COMBO_43_11]
PAEFFKTMPKTGGFLEPLIFAIIMGVVAGIIHALIGIFGLTYIGKGFTESLGLIILYPIVIAILSFIIAAILFVIWKVMGSPENFETAYRCGAYLSALAPIIAIIGIIPYVGGIINMAVYVFYLVIASTQVHNIPSQKAWLIFGVIGGILALLAITAEYKARHMAPTAEQYRRTAEEINKQYQQHLEEVKKQMEEARKDSQRDN